MNSEVIEKNETIPADTAIVKKIIFWVSIAMCLFQVYTAATIPLQSMLQRSIHFAFALPLMFLYKSVDNKKPALRLLYYIMAVLGVAVNIYMMFEWANVNNRITTLLPLDYVMGITCIVLVMVSGYMYLGIWMPLIAGVFMLYSFTCQYLPGIFHFREIPLRRFITAIYFGSDGIFGSCIGVSATFVYSFLIFGEALLQLGAGDFIIDLSQAAFGTVRGGSGKIAILASSLFGAVSGSTTANISATGVLTIPLMKKHGFDSEYSGGVVAAASTGGQIMPPVMGNAAFIMSEMLAVGYHVICVAALVPALLYYLALFIMVDLRAVKNHLTGQPREELPEMHKVMKEGWHHILSFVVLIVLLIVLQWSAAKAAFWATVSLFVFEWGKQLLITKEKIDLKVLPTIAVNASKGCLGIVASTTLAGIIIGAFTATGLNLRFSTLLIELAGGSLFILLILSAIGAIILGMGLPTTPAYILMAVLAAPAITQMGVPAIAAHMFVFYFAVMAPITPPVGIGFYVSAGIAQSAPLKTGFAAWKVAIPGFILPFVWIYNPGLILQGSFLQCIVPIITSTIGIIALSVGVEGYMKRKLTAVERIIAIAAAVLLIIPESITDIVGIVLAVFIFVTQLVLRRKPVEATA